MGRAGLFSRARRPRAAGIRRSVRRLCLCLAVTLSLCAVTIWIRVGPVVRSYGEEMFYYLIVPGWVRWLLEPAPLIVTPREGFEPATAKGGGGALPTGVERWGDYLITRISATPNVTLVHNFMTREECAFVRALGHKMGMVSGTRFPVTNGKVDASAASLYDYVYGLVRTSVGEYAYYDQLMDANDLRRMVAIAKKVQAVTGLEVGNSEAPFVQHYGPSARFRAHYDMYNVDVTAPFPYRDNPRSRTLLAYLNDVGANGGGETEFMLAKPRPIRVVPAEGAALIWGNCELEDVAPVDTRVLRGRGGGGGGGSGGGARGWDEGRCMGGAGPHGEVATSPGPLTGETVQWPCCVRRTRASLHQSRPVRVGHEKWTMTMWMHQRFTSESQAYADELGYSRDLAEPATQS